jgi:hypothetical protein
MTLAKLAQLDMLLGEYLEELGDKTMKIEDYTSIEHTKKYVFNDIREQIYAIGKEHDIEDESEEIK